MKRRSIKTLQDAGVLKEARKQGDYGEAKELLYSTYDALTWVSFMKREKLLHVDLASGDLWKIRKRHWMFLLTSLLLRPGWFRRSCRFRECKGAERGLRQQR